MGHGIKWLLAGVLLLVATVAGAAQWPQLTQRLQQWAGAREVVLPAGVDALADPQLASVVEVLLEQGYAVLPAGSELTEGLALELKQTVAGQRLILKRQSDGALLAMEKMVSLPAAEAVVLSTGATTPAPVVVPPTMAATAPAAPAQPAAALPASEPVTLIAPTLATAASRVSVQSTPQANVLSAQHSYQAAPVGEVLFELDGAPLQVVAWPAAGGAVDLFLLYDRYVQQLRYDGRMLESRGRFEPPLAVARALHLEIGDLDRDGHPELATTWAEDVRAVDSGDNSLLHSWVLSVSEQGLEAISEDLEGYVALDDGQGRLQRRTEYQPFSDEIYGLSLIDGQVTVSAAPLSRDARLLFNQLAWPDEHSALVWNDEQRLMLVARSTQQRLPGSTLLTDFGIFDGPVVSVPLENPEYRSGFSVADQVLTRETHLARRLVAHDDAVYTIVRGRTMGMPLIGRAQGTDRLVRIERQGNSLQARYPYRPVEAFIVDFALTGPGVAQAVVLLNEKVDGRGSAYLRILQPL